MLLLFFRDLFFLLGFFQVLLFVISLVFSFGFSFMCILLFKTTIINDKER